MVTDGSRFYMSWDNSDILFNETAPSEVPPFSPADPFPADRATQVGLTPLLAGGEVIPIWMVTLTYDVYFGTSSPPSLLSIPLTIT
ncbi:MAG: hypothetical protein AB1478_08680 [Nitrospirota bacterium]